MADTPSDRAPGAARPGRTNPGGGSPKPGAPSRRRPLAAGSGDAALTQQALAAAAAAVEAIAERLLAERDAAIARFGDLGRRLHALEQRPERGDGGGGVAPAVFEAVTGRLEQGIEALRVGLDLSDQHRSAQRLRADRLDERLTALAAQIGEEPVGALVQQALAGHGPEGSRLDALEARLHGIETRIDALHDRQHDEAQTQTQALKALERRLAGLEAGTAADLPPTPAASPVAAPAPVDATADAALADLALRLQAAGDLRAQPWEERQRYRDDLCALAGWLIGDYLPPNPQAAALQAVDGWLAEQGDGAVRLILPGAGSPFDSTQHERIETVTASGGMLRSVLRLVRPGLRCGATVRRKAEVVAS